MTDEKLAKAKDLSRKITDLSTNLERAKSIKTAAAYVGYMDRNGNRCSVDLLTAEVKSIIQTIAIADLEKQLATARAEYEAL